MQLSVFKYVLSPPGAGKDCFRTWEALYCGVVPIVENWDTGCPFYFLPALEVCDISRPSAAIHCNEYVEKNWRVKYEFERLKISYWRDIILSKI